MSASQPNSGSQLSSEIYSSPVVDSDGNVFFGSDNSFFYAVSPVGSLLTKLETDGSVRTSAAISNTGVVYFGTTGNDLWAVHAIPPSVSPVIAPAIFPPIPPVIPPFTDSSSSLSSSSYLTTAAIVGISLGLGFCCFFIFILSLLFMLKKSLIDYEEGKQSLLSNIGGWMMISNSNSRKSNHLSKSTCVAFNLDHVIIPQISWNDIKVPQVNKVEDLVLGKGSFGTVYRARLERTDPQTRVKSYEDVVVKIMSESVRLTARVTDRNTELLQYTKSLNVAKIEAAVVIETENRMTIKDSIIKVYGIAHGSIPPHLAVPLEIPRNCQAIGIVMRSESGGSLDALCHPKDPATPPIPMIEKLRLITELAKGIADMHAAGIIHGDLKPDNVLLSSDTPCKVRLADFGLATLRDSQDGTNNSTLMQTTKTKGTPVYCAPEMFVNPYAVVLEDKVAKASRKTDMYAFALIAWEVLTQKRPFVEVQKEMLLVAKIYSGERPSVNDIPIECPADVAVMIQNTWDLDRNKRGFAMECFNLLQYEYSSLSRQLFDVFISYEESSFSVAKYVSFKLAQVGIMVCLIPVGKRAQVTDELARSTVVIALLSKTFQETPGCMAELNAARGFKPPKTILPVMLDTNYAEWADMQLIYLCQLNSSAIVKYDLSVYRHIMIEMPENIDTDNDGCTEVMYEDLMLELARMETEVYKYLRVNGMSSVHGMSQHRSRIIRTFERTRSVESTSKSMRSLPSLKREGPSVSFNPSSSSSSSSGLLTDRDMFARSSMTQGASANAQLLPEQMPIQENAVSTISTSSYIHVNEDEKDDLEHNRVSFILPTVCVSDSSLLTPPQSSNSSSGTNGSNALGSSNQEQYQV